MAYIGKQPIVGNFQVCDAISVVNGQAAYTMQVDSTNVQPETANHMLVSLNGVLQKPGSSFTISGSTITFASNLATGDVIDFILLLGDVLNIGTPSDNGVTTSSIAANAVTAAKFNADVISGQTALGAEPADTDEFLVSDAGVLKRVDYSYIKGGGITEADMFRMTANLSSNADPISANLERVDDATFGKIGTGVTESSGTFSFASTGLYLVSFHYEMQVTGTDSWQIGIDGSSDNFSSEDVLARHVNYSPSSMANEEVHFSMQCFFNCTDTSTHKIQFSCSSISNVVFRGDTNYNKTYFTFIRLGDSV